MRPLRLQFWISALAILALGSVCASAQTQPDEVSLGTSTTELQLSGGGSGSSTITVSIDSAAPATFVDGAGLSVTCPGGASGGYLFACASASGSGTLAEWKQWQSKPALPTVMPAM